MKKKVKKRKPKYGMTRDMEKQWKELTPEMRSYLNSSMSLLLNLFSHEPCVGAIEFAKGKSVIGAWCRCQTRSWLIVLITEGLTGIQMVNLQRQCYKWTKGLCGYRSTDVLRKKIPLAQLALHVMGILYRNKQ